MVQIIGEIKEFIFGGQLYQIMEGVFSPGKPEGCLLVASNRKIAGFSESHNKWRIAVRSGKYTGGGIKTDAEEGQERLEKLTSHISVLAAAIVYVGVSSFDRSLTYAKSLHEKGADVTIVTCACNDSGDKFEAIKSGPVERLVIVKECGGEKDMGRIVKAAHMIRSAEVFDHVDVDL